LRQNPIRLTVDDIQQIPQSIGTEELPVGASQATASGSLAIEINAAVDCWTGDHRDPPGVGAVDVAVCRAAAMPQASTVSWASTSLLMQSTTSLCCRQVDLGPVRAEQMSS